MRWFNISVVFAAMLLILGLASSAQAADVMYKASLSIQAFGNDTTTGLSYPFNSTVFVGVPFGLTCNPYYGAGTNWCIGTTSMAQAGSPLTGSGSASVTGFAPAAFTLPLSGLSRVLGTPGVPGGSFYGYYPYMYSFTYADLKNSNASWIVSIRLKERRP